MYTDTKFRCILIADCGVEYTRLSLVDLIEGELYRLVAQHELPSTIETPFSNIMGAIQQAIPVLERKTGRQLLQAGQLRIPQGRDGQGLDAFVATCSAAGSLPVLVLAVTADITAQSAVRAIEGTYAVPFRIVTMEDILQDNPLDREKSGPSENSWWQVLQDFFPGSLLMVGGVGGGNTTPLRTLARVLGEALPPRATRLEEQVGQPDLPVVYAGNEQAQKVVEQQLAERVDLRIVENVRPHLRQEELPPARQEIEQIFSQQILQSLDGYEELSAWSQTPVQLSYMSLQLITRFLAAHHQSQVLSLDVGSGATTMIWADPEQSKRVVLGNFGLSYGIGRVLAQCGVERIRRWIPFPIPAEQVRAWILNQALRYRTTPTTIRDLLIQQAVAREVLAEAQSKLQEQIPAGAEVIVATGGGLIRAPRWSQSLAILLDALDLSQTQSGLVNIYLDRSGILTSIGVLATINPDAAASVLLQDGLFQLGTCLIPLGQGRAGSRALTVELEFTNGMRQKTEVDWGELLIIPFRWGTEAHLTVKPARRTKLGRGPSGQPLTTKEGTRIQSGLLGLIIDARGRPLELPQDDNQRLALLRSWLEQTGAYTEAELDSVLPPPPAGETTEQAAPGPKAPVEAEAVVEAESDVETEAPMDKERLPWE
ncbi:MAG: glutamate mutase L [Chloroflexia bacterium]|nr:glutamate mutase L [Chloroflexia bacterium]